MFSEPAARRGDVYELKAPKTPKGHEQSGRRFAVILQTDDYQLSTIVITPTSTGQPESFLHPEIEVNGQTTRVLVEQIQSVSAEHRLGRRVGHLRHQEMEAVSKACKILLDL